MGLVLMAALFAGSALGLLVSSVTGGAGVVLTVRSARIRSRVWWIFAAVFAIVLPACIVAVHLYPYDAVRPGSDYDVAMKNLFLQGLGYCASPGTAMLLAAVATWLIPKNSVDNPPATSGATTLD